jgi:hypothetical protein
VTFTNSVTGFEQGFEHMWKSLKAEVPWLVLLLVGSGQTTQVRAPISVVEWSKCAGSGPCNGIELFQFRLADGSVDGPFLAVKAPASFARDAKWQPVPVAWTCEPLAPAPAR